MTTPLPVRKVCQALYEAMAELDTFEDRQEPASPTTCGSFKECLEMLHDLAAAKGFLTPSRHPASHDPRASQAERSPERSREPSEEQPDPAAPEKVGLKPTLFL